MKKQNEKRYVNDKERNCSMFGCCGITQKMPVSSRIALYGLHCLEKGNRE